MHHPDNPSKLLSKTLIITLIVFWGCSSPVPVQESHSKSTPSGGESQSAKKTSDLSPGEGLWLMSQLDNPIYEELQQKGLQLPADSIYNSQKPSLSNAIINITIDGNNRGTGAFISNRGLILTNYRTAIDGIAAQSSPNQNYLQDGFLAENNNQEIPLPNYNLRILLEQKDITNFINKELADSLTYREKKKQIQQTQKQIIRQQKADQKDITVAINEAWSGNRYIMSVYKKIDDVRLVHAPKKSDAFSHQNTFNQSWPSHAADYTMLRAYVAPSGQSRTYDRSNVPFTSNRHLKIDTSEIRSADHTITLGYPGQTHRQESSYAVNFYQDHRNPILIDSYRAILDAARQAAAKDPAIAITNAQLRMSATQNKTYFKQLQYGFQNDSIRRSKADIEQQFSKWVKRDSLRNLTYRRVLPQLEQAYNIASQSGSTLFTLVNTINNSKILQIAGIYHSYRKHISDTTNPALANADKEQLLNRHKSILENIHLESQQQLLGDMLHTLSTLPEGNIPFYLLELFDYGEGDTLKKEIDSYLANQQEYSVVFDPKKGQTLLQLSADSARNHPTDDLVTLYKELLDTYQFSRENYAQHVPYLQPAQERYVDGLLTFQSNMFPYPDANGTLRLSLGQVKGYTTPQGKVHTPFTESGNQKVNFLTTNDITGNAYGSPVLNNNGHLIGLTSYRTPEGIASDFSFNAKLHRTINVNIRYIINLMSEFSGSQKLLKEMDF